MNPLHALHQQVLQRLVGKKCPRIRPNFVPLQRAMPENPLFLSAPAQVAAMACSGPFFACFWPFLACLSPPSGAQAAALERGAGPPAVRLAGLWQPVWPAGAPAAARRAVGGRDPGGLALSPAFAPILLHLVRASVLYLVRASMPCLVHAQPPA